MLSTHTSKTTFRLWSPEISSILLYNCSFFLELICFLCLYSEKGFRGAINEGLASRSAETCAGITSLRINRTLKFMNWMKTRKVCKFPWFLWHYLFFNGCNRRKFATSLLKSLKKEVRRMSSHYNANQASFYIYFFVGLTCETVEILMKLVNVAESKSTVTKNQKWTN